MAFVSHRTTMSGFKVSTISLTLSARHDRPLTLFTKRQREGEENYGRKLGEEVDLINEKGTRMGWGEGDFQG